ncbi:helix-turn-helix domain-containing protein [Planctomycetaceae bacterium]|nr:helix-turn-helix domain-containing protein [Planctomycetaceae bacterium]
MNIASHQTESEQLLLPASEAARLLGISKRHLHTLNVSGRLPRPIRLGRSVRWNADELRAWIAAGCPERSRWEASME